jgi:hypothetical protein
MDPPDINDGVEIISYAIQNNCSREIYDLLFKAFADTVLQSFRFLFSKYSFFCF